ncbi:MAG: hypothetical protein FVQ83_13875 [Chloroflexi bacterium]|nr:hypothetical protein [Chloroflexota bacterium]
MYIDPRGDQTIGFPDIFEVKAFNYAEYFYIYISEYSSGEFGEYGIDIESECCSSVIHLGVFPNQPESSFTYIDGENLGTAVEWVEAVFGEIIEIRMPLEEFDGYPVILFTIQVWQSEELGDETQNIQPLVFEDK